jgi:hypothetical protein
MPRRRPAPPAPVCEKCGFPVQTLTYLSLGAGVQSTALLVMSAKELHGCPRADVAIFADTQGEPAHVYESLRRCEAFGAANGIEVVTVTQGDLGGRLIARARGEIKSASMIPAFVVGRDGKAAPLGRNCTRDHKLSPIVREVRRRVGKKGTATALIGISTDEAHRMKPALHPWLVNRYPLVEAGLNRDDCLRIIAESGLPVPEKSACYFCPYHSNGYWLDMKRRHPNEWAAACFFDAKIRDMSKAGVRGDVYLHRSMVPLANVDLNESQGELFGNECEGMCGV